MLDIQNNHVMSSYFAPRGRDRMFALGMQLAQLYLSPFDKLIGIIGEAGSGKSALIRGMFPGLELTNDDDNVYVRPLPLLELDMQKSFFMPHTYHVDIRFENGFTQMSALADAINEALRRGKRVVVEHFDLVCPFVNTRADLLIGVGEQVLISRPTLFGPDPQDVRATVYKSLHYRLMAHTAEDLCEYCMPFEEWERCGHDDAKHGFVIFFPETQPKFDILELEQKVNEMIRQNLSVTYYDEQHVSIGGEIHRCTGPRIHVGRTGQIENFHLLNHFIYDPFKRRYLLVGCVGENAEENLKLLESHQQTAWD